MPRHGFDPVASFPTAAEAEVVRALLGASGIDAHLAGTSHLVREHIPGGEVAVLVPAADVARAREIVASARVADEPGDAPPPARRHPAYWKGMVAAGLALLVAWAAMLLLGRGARVAEVCLRLGALLAALGAVNGLLERRERARHRG